MDEVWVPFMTENSRQREVYVYGSDSVVVCHLISLSAGKHQSGSILCAVASPTRNHIYAGGSLTSIFAADVHTGRRVIDVRSFELLSSLFVCCNVFFFEGRRKGV